MGKKAVPLDVVLVGRADDHGPCCFNFAVDFPIAPVGVEEERGGGCERVRPNNVVERGLGERVELDVL